MKPRKLCFGPVLPLPKQLTPPPLSQPASPVRDVAAMLINDFGALVVLVLNAVVGMVAGAAGYAKSVLAVTVLVADDRPIAVWPPQDLTAKTGPIVEPAVGLPAVDEPGFDLQLGCGEPLHAHAVEEPGRVRRDIRRLIRPVVKLVVGEQADIRHEDACVDVYAMLYIEVIAAIGLRDVPVCIREIPLSARRACVVARRGLGVKAELCHKAGPYIAVVEVAADSELSLHFT